MLFASVIATVSVLATLAQGAAVQRATTCSTIDTGDFATFTGKLSLSSDNQVITGSSNPFQASFQSCPDAPPNTEYNDSGRIVVSTSNLCLTLTNPTDATGPYYVKAEACTSDSNPSPGQLWGYGNDFGNVIFATGSKNCSTGGAGITNSEDMTGKPIQLGCTDSWSSMNLEH